MSDEHSTVDGTLIQAWASQKSFRFKDGSGDWLWSICPIKLHMMAIARTSHQHTVRLNL
jgi:hypothetical protein